jgi:cell division protein ZapA
MDSQSTPEKQSVRLSIFNQTFTLKVAGDPAEIEEAAHEVDELMHTIARSGNVDTLRAAILACLHLQDRVKTLERERHGAPPALEQRIRQLTELLDSTVAGRDEPISEPRRQ